MTVNIFIIDGKTSKKKLRESLPDGVREQLESVGVEVDIEDAEEIRDELPPGLPRSFVVPEQVLTFPVEKKDTGLPKLKRLISDSKAKRRRRKTAGNAGG